MYYAFCEPSRRPENAHDERKLSQVAHSCFRLDTGGDVFMLLENRNKKDGLSCVPRQGT